MLADRRPVNAGLLGLGEAEESVVFVGFRELADRSAIGVNENTFLLRDRRGVMGGSKSLRDGSQRLGHDNLETANNQVE